ncbi:MAG: hypothetical protein Q8K78_12270 [Planctomycetaceae bacterium]|nr:hypothetical protein [Planctomycetaceae bacterium]
MAISRSLSRFLLISAVTVWFVGCSRPAQIGVDETAWKEAEALYTAVTARKPDLLEASRERLRSLHESGRIQTPAFEQLNRIADQAHGGEWDPAAQALWKFMRGQRKAH